MTDRERATEGLISTGISGAEATKMVDFALSFGKKLENLIESENHLWKGTLEPKSVLTVIAAALGKYGEAAHCAMIEEPKR